MKLNVSSAMRIQLTLIAIQSFLQAIKYDSIKTSVLTSLKDDTNIIKIERCKCYQGYFKKTLSLNVEYILLLPCTTCNDGNDKPIVRNAPQFKVYMYESIFLMRL